MSKAVTHAVEIRDPIQPEVGPDRYLFIVATDDDSVYEFQKMEDAPIWNLRSRGSLDESPELWTSRRAPLPSDVKETLNDELGKKSWQK